MAGLKDRERALENKYFRDEETKFRVISRRRKFLGQWAAEKMHKDEEEIAAYAKEIVQFGVQDHRDGAVITRVLNDILSAGVEMTEEGVRDAMHQCERRAISELEKELTGK